LLAFYFKLCLLFISSFALKTEFLPLAAGQRSLFKHLSAFSEKLIMVSLSMYKPQDFLNFFEHKGSYKSEILNCKIFEKLIFVP
jgi:hypothetical protein